MYDISQFKSELQPKLHDLSLSKLSGSIYDKLYEASRSMLTNIDPKETIRIVPFENAIYDNIYSYVCPSDLKDNKIITIRPQAVDVLSGNYRQRNIKEFGLQKDDSTFVVEYDDTIKTLRLSQSSSESLLVSPCDSLGGFGTGDQCNNLSISQIDYITGTGSLKFDMTSGATTGYVDNSSLEEIDITNYTGQGAVFMWVKFPTYQATQNITNINLRIGSSSLNYFSVDATSAHDQTGFKQGWNLIRFNLQGASETGTVNNESINYLKVTFTSGGLVTFTGLQIDSILISNGSPYEMVYYSESLFRNTNGEWINKPTSDNDIINLGHTSLNILLYEVAYLIAQELQGENSRFDLDFFEKEKNNAYKKYGGANKSQVTRPQNTYYRLK